jgi:HAD superfamily hydrolase (TIGR01509 family)
VRRSERSEIERLGLEGSATLWGVPLPDAVLFDLFATLAYEDFGALVAEEAAFLGVTVAAFEAANAATRPERSRTPDPIESTSLLLRALDCDVSLAAQIFDMQSTWLAENGRLYDDAIPTLLDLRRAGVKTAVICNGSAFIRQWMNVNGLREAADVVILSAEESTAKPEAAIFRLACQRLDVPVSPLCWFVDDQPAYLIGARTLGMRCWRIARPETGVHDGDDLYESISDLSPVVSAVMGGSYEGRDGVPDSDELVLCHHRLLADLAALTLLLRRIELDHWAEWFETDAMRIDSGDAFGLTHILSAYGGMGSFNDVVVDPRNGHPVSAAQADRLDHQLQILRSRIWSDTTVLWRSASTRP